MTKTEESAIADVGFGNLCELVAAYLESGRESRALALAMAYLVFDDSAAFTKRSAAHEKGPATIDKLRAVDADLDQRRSGVDLDGDWLVARFADSPLSLLSWLDHRFATNAGATLTPAWLSTRDVETVKLQAEELESLGIHTALADYFVFPKFQAHLRAPVQTQTHDPGRFLQYWEVLPEVIDLGQRSRRLAVHSGASGYRDGWRRPSDAGRLRVYLCEFAEPPLFASHWEQGPQWRIWTAEGLHNETDMIDSVRQHLKRAIALRADVIVLPELTITPPILSAMRQQLKTIATSDIDAAPCMVVAGSFHVNEVGDVFNQCVILDGAGRSVEINGAATWRYRKQTQVELSAPGAMVMEGNRPGQLQSMVPTPIGPQSIAICLDLGQGAAADAVRLEKVPFRWLWVPSMSASVSAHKTRASAICLQRVATISCANQAKANFGEGLELTGAAGQSFVWGNELRRSAAVVPVDEEKSDGNDWWALFELPLERFAP